MEVYRYERKYTVTEPMAAAIRHFASAYLVHDEHMRGCGADGYRVCSLYLDSPQLELYRQSCDGVKNRFKLRIRFYEESPGSPAFLEIKRRTTETVHKLRSIVSKPVAERMLAGERIDVSDLTSCGDGSRLALNEFLAYRDRLNADGVVYVDYMREAFVSQSAEAVRVTFDRYIVARKYSCGDGLSVPRDSSLPVTNHVVLELKYNGRAPRWMHDLATTFNLQRLSFPKYVRCADTMDLAPRRPVAVVRSF